MNFKSPSIHSWIFEEAHSYGQKMSLKINDLHLDLGADPHIVQRRRKFTLNFLKYEYMKFLDLYIKKLPS